MWRTIGAVAITACGVMAWYGVETLSRGQSWWYLLIYWSIFLFLLIVAMYMVLIDFRYVRLRFLIDQRDTYMKTLGNEEFRRKLRAAQEARKSAPQTRSNGNGHDKQT